MSYDDHPLIRKLYGRRFNVIEVEKVNYSMNQRPGTKSRFRTPKLLITNF